MKYQSSATEIMRNTLNEFDKFLIEIVVDKLPKKTQAKEKTILVTLPNKRRIIVDPVDVIHVLLKTDEIDGLSDIDSDEAYNMRERVKGKLKGGKITKRDKHFDIPRSHPFWDWWHNYYKAQNGGRDIQDKEELIRHFEAYNNEVSKFLYQSSVRISINRLNSKRREFARKVINNYFRIFISKAY